MTSIGTLRTGGVNQDRCDEQLPNPHNILLAMVMWMGRAAAINDDLVLGAAWFATCLAYWVRGEVDGAEEASRPEVSG